MLKCFEKELSIDYSDEKRIAENYKKLLEKNIDEVSNE